MKIKHRILHSINRYYVLYTILFIYLIWPSRFAMIYYENYDLDEIHEKLVKSKNSSSLGQDLFHCVSD